MGSEITPDKKTGRKDKGGVEIYAGDVLSSGTGLPRICEVYYNSEAAAFHVRQSPDFDNSLDSFMYINRDIVKDEYPEPLVWESRVEIIGHISQYPELLDG